MLFAVALWLRGGRAATHEVAVTGIAVWCQDIVSSSISRGAAHSLLDLSSL